MIQHVLLFCIYCVLTAFIELILASELPNGLQTLFKTVRHVGFLRCFNVTVAIREDFVLTGTGALSTHALQRVVLDASHIDKKSKGILELKDTHMPLMRLLALPALKDMYDKGAEIIFY